MNKLFLYTTLVVITMYSAQAETIAGYSFEKYPAKVYTGKKAPLNLEDWGMFRTRLKEAHKDGQVGFAGNYIVTTWGCGAGCLSGAMIDKRTGKVYGLPLGETDDGITPYESGPECNGYAEEAELDDNERLAFFPNSRLFITRSCEGEKIDATTGKQILTYYINIWDEKTKKFITKKVIKSKVVKMDYSQW